MLTASVLGLPDGIFIAFGATLVVSVILLIALFAATRDIGKHGKD